REGGRIDHMVLLYDGICGFCNGVVQFLLAHDRKGTLQFAALQSEYARDVLETFPEYRNVDSVVLYDPETNRATIRSTAGLELARYLGFPWNLAILCYLIPRFFRDYLYNQFAKRRYRWFGKYETCKVPTPEVRSRFVDQPA